MGLAMWKATCGNHDPLDDSAEERYERSCESPSGWYDDADPGDDEEEEND